MLSNGFTLPIRKSTLSTFCCTWFLLTRFRTRSRFVQGFFGSFFKISCPPFPEKLHAEYVGRIERGFNSLEKSLETKTFLVGERFTLADIHVASVFLRAAKWFLDKSNIDKYPSVVRFVETVLNQPKIAEFWTVQWQEKVAPYTPPPRETKEPKAAPATRPKKQEKPKPKEPEQEEDGGLAPGGEPKPKHPLDSLPKSTFNLEDWKRAYSNKDTKGPGGSIEWFYEQWVISFLTRGRILIAPQLR